MMKMSKLSNQTNSQDPQAINSRVFVGNLNTFQCSKTDVERMFQRYGRLAGISMHKGYAFVQFTNPFDARNACHGEDGKTVLNQVLDVNLVAEPKVSALNASDEIHSPTTGTLCSQPHQIGRKRQNIAKTDNDWDYFYDSYYTSTIFPGVNTQPRTAKRQRLMTPPQTRSTGIIASPQIVLQSPQSAQQQMTANKLSSAAANLLQLQHQQQLLLAAAMPMTNSVQCQSSIITNGDHEGPTPPTVDNFKLYSNPDILICGNCRELFADLNEFLEHRRAYCKLRFTCKCQDQHPIATNSKSQNSSSRLVCVACKDAFSNPWDLMVHVQAAHMVNIYEIGDFDGDSDSNKGINGNSKSSKLDKTNGESLSSGASSCNGSVVHPNENENGSEAATSPTEVDRGHSSSSDSSATNELFDSAKDNELIIDTNGLDTEIRSVDLSPSESISPSSRSTSTSDKENEWNHLHHVVA